MHALFFEVRPKQGHLKHYFEHVDVLKPVLAKHEGLVFLDRYTSISDKDVLLSHQLWKNDAAIAAWRRDRLHQRSQAAGRNVHFEDYRIRVAERILHVETGEKISQARGPTVTLQDKRFMVAAYGTQEPHCPSFAGFRSVNDTASYIAVAEVANYQEAEALAKSISAADGYGEATVFRVLRDYGMHNRAEAPTFLTNDDS